MQGPGAGAQRFPAGGVGTRLDLAETFELHADGRTKVVRETRSLQGVNEAMTEIDRGDLEARLVFDLRR